MSKTVDTLIEAKQAYYNGTPIMSDADFDKLEDELRSEDPTNPYFENIGAPTEGSNKRKHKIAMGSLAKCKIDDGGLETIATKFLAVGDCAISYKMDGISFAVDYVNGEYQHATTRGDGFIGEDIPNATEFKHTPTEAKLPITATARGELIITYEDFELINEQLSDDEKFSNPRNAVAGIARKEDSPFRKYITAYYYDLVGDVEVTTKSEIFEHLGEIFGEECVVRHNPSFGTFEEFAEDLDKNRKNLPYMIDGIVVEFDDIQYFKSLGVSGNKPKGAIALKFNAVAETTKVTDVVWQVGSTGNLTPVVEFEPTLIDGSIVRRASIHNYDIFNEWAFNKGDIISVQKNNDIIPQVKDVIDRDCDERNILKAPEYCPICGHILSTIKVSKTTNLVCTNPLCEAKYVGAIKKWCTKSGMASKGVGDAFFEAYAEKYESITEIYFIDAEDIMCMSDRYKEKSSTKIYNAIQSSKTMKLMDFFGGLNIHGAGSRTFKKIIDAHGLKTVEEVVEFIKTADLSLIDGIGDITAKVIKDGIEKCSFIIEVFSEIITIEKEDEISSDAHSFLFTGAFKTIDPETGKGYKRNALEALVSSKGHTPASSVNKDLNYLVTSDPDSTSSKMVKARKLGVVILGEDEFFGMMG